MSKALFGNSKVALGFAGVVIVLALIASAGFSAFTPVASGGEEADEAEIQAEAQAEDAPEPEQRQASQDAGGWDDAGHANGWGVGSTYDPSDTGGLDGGFADGGTGEPEFGDYDGGASRPSPSSPGGPSTAAPTVVSGAAPGAPGIRPPSGQSGPQEPTIVEIE